jgi:hypothetical protein
MPDSNGRFQKGEHWREPRPHWDEAWLRERYEVREMSSAEIAEEAGCTDGGILYWLAKHGIPRRSTSEARAAKHWGVTGENNPMHGRTGESNPNYKDGSSPLRQRMYARGEGNAFLRQILKRDGYRCRKCGEPKRGRKSLHVHHIRPWAGNPALRFDAENVVTLCRPCHSWVHSRDNSDGDYLDV